MSFANLHYIWILIIFIILFAGGYYLQLTRQKQLSAWIKSDFWHLLIPDYSKNRFKLKWIFFSLGIFFILLALLRPQWGEHEDTIESKGMDLMFVLDLSNSMLCEDASPSRLNRAQVFIKKTLSLLADDKVGTVGFAGKAFLAIPLTTDFDYVSEVVDSLSPLAIAEQGTELGAAIDVSIKAFERGGSDSRKTSRAIILISDGEDFGLDATKAASKVKDFGAGFFAFSVGTPEGAPIPIRNESGVLQTYKKDRSGKTILSKPNPDLLSKVAAAAGGKFFELTNVDDAAYILNKQLLAFHRDSTKEQRQVTKIDRYQPFLALGVLFLLISFFIGYEKIFKNTPIILLLCFFCTQGNAQTLGGYWKNKRGIQKYDDKNYEESSKIFEEARSKDSDNPIIEYNQATALSKAKKDEDAIFHYEEATKKSLNQGDFETAAKSLYNEGLIQKENKNYQESFHQFTNAIEMAKISNQPELEKKAREALLQSSQEQQQKKQEEKNDSKDQKKPKDSKDQKNQDQKPQDQNQDKKQNPQMDDGKKREFKSGTLSKDVAEGIMNDLSDREKQLYQHRMKEKKSKESQNEKDW